jgi:hypothetical protein
MELNDNASNLESSVSGIRLFGGAPSSLTHFAEIVIPSGNNSDLLEVMETFAQIKRQEKIDAVKPRIVQQGKQTLERLVKTMSDLGLKKDFWALNTIQFDGSQTDEEIFLIIGKKVKEELPFYKLSGHIVDSTMDVSFVFSAHLSETQELESSIAFVDNCSYLVNSVATNDTLTPESLEELIKFLYEAKERKTLAEANYKNEVYNARYPSMKDLMGDPTSYVTPENVDDAQKIHDEILEYIEMSLTPEGLSNVVISVARFFEDYPELGFGLLRHVFMLKAKDVELQQEKLNIDDETRMRLASFSEMVSENKRQ